MAIHSELHATVKADPNECWVFQLRKREIPIRSTKKFKKWKKTEQKMKIASANRIEKEIIIKNVKSKNETRDSQKQIVELGRK